MRFHDIRDNKFYHNMGEIFAYYGGAFVLTERTLQKAIDITVKELRWHKELLENYFQANVARSRIDYELSCAHVKAAKGILRCLLSLPGAQQTLGVS